MAGRSGDIYLEDAVVDGGYGITADLLSLNGFCTVGDEYSVGIDSVRVAAAKAGKYPYFVAWAKCSIDPGGGTRTPTLGAPQWSDAEVLAVNSIVAAEHDAVWRTGGGVDQAWITSAAPLSRATIHFPQGSFAINHPLLSVYGTYLGWGNSQYANDANDFNQTTYGTRLFVDHANWIDDGLGSVGAPERYIWRSVNFIEEIGGVKYGGINGDVTYQNQLAAYLEGCIIAGFHLVGRKEDVAGNDDGWSYDPSYHSSGIAMLRLGSASSIALNRCDGFNDAGIELCGGTPATLYGNRTFFNNRAGVWIRGAAQVWITSHEGDDNPTLYLYTDYSTPTGSVVIAPNGANVAAVGSKMESGTQSLDGVSIILAGTAAVNSFLYFREGSINGYPRYTKRGGTVDVDSVYRDPAGPSGDRWYIKSAGTIMYRGTPSGGSPNDPWASSAWTASAGVAPVPEVRQGRPTKGQMLLDMEGWGSFTFTGVDYAGLNSYSECLCRWKPGTGWDPNPADFASYISVDGFKVFGYIRTLVHHADGANSRKYLLDGSEYGPKYKSTIRSFKYNSIDGGMIETGPGRAIRQIDVTSPNRLMWLEQSQSGNPAPPLFNDNAGTPVYQF